MTSSWTAQPLLASPRSACIAAEQNPSDSGHGRWIFALGPCWVRAAAVAHGRQRSPTVQTNRRSSILQLTQQRRSERAIQIVVPKVGLGASGQQMGSNRPP